MIYRKEFKDNVIRRKNNSFIVVILAMIAGVAGAVIMYYAGTQYFNLTTQVVAVRDLPPFTVIRESDIKTMQVTRSSAKGTADKKILVGRITKCTVPTNTIILPDHLVPKGDGSLLAGRIEALKDPDLRAFALPAEALQACGGMIKEGDKVDIVGALQVSTSNKTSTKEYVSKILASGVKVLEPLGEGSDQKGIIVALDPGEIQEIQFALLAGKVSVALNPYTSNQKASQTLPTTMETFTKKLFQLDSEKDQQDPAAAPAQPQATTVKPQPSINPKSSKVDKF